MANKTITVPSFWTTSRTAREIQRSESFIRKLANNGQLACVFTQSGQRLFMPSDVQKLAQERGNK